MMRKSYIPALALTLTATLFAPVAARAGHSRVGVSWSIASSFRVGGADVALVFGQPSAYGPAYYYRTRYPLPGFYGPRCMGCFVRGGFYYYDVASPVIDAYFAHYAFPATRFWVGIGPWTVAPRARLYRPAPRPRVYAPPIRRHVPGARHFAPRRHGHDVRDRGRRGAWRGRGHGRHR
jgi:hypothetical protein